MHDFSKPPHVTSPEETAKKRRLPVYILIIVGLFLLALVVYMVADHSKTPKEEAVKLFNFYSIKEFYYLLMI